MPLGPLHVTRFARPPSPTPELSPTTATRIGLLVQEVNQAPLLPQVGPLEPLSTLAAEYPHNQSYQRQITQVTGRVLL
jgi:hypothetical protein